MGADQPLSSLYEIAACDVLRCQTFQSRPAITQLRCHVLNNMGPKECLLGRKLAEVFDLHATIADEPEMSGRI